MVKIPKSVTRTTDRDRCVKKFTEWWSKEELVYRIIPEMGSSHVFELIKRIRGFTASSYDATVLGNILYEIVGPNFLRKISDDNKKTRKFRELILDAAIKKGLADGRKIIDMAREKEGARIRSLTDVAAIDATVYWMKILAKELDLPISVGQKERREKPPEYEIIEPNGQLNPLYDYQYETGLFIRNMLEGNGPKRSMISVPTGAGKTRLVVETLIEWLNDGKPGSDQQRNSSFILWLAQSNELCEQAFSTFKEVFKSRGKTGTTLTIHRFWGSGAALPQFSMEDLLGEKGIIVANIQSFDKVAKNQPEQLNVLSDLVSCIIVDEAHHSITKSYNRFFEAMGFNFRLRKDDPSTKGIILLGLTATPFRGAGTVVIDGTVQLNEETEQLQNRYGSVRYPEIYVGLNTQNSHPHALIDCPPSGRVGYPMRILGERSYDKDGYIKSYRWTVIKQPRVLDVLYAEQQAVVKKPVEIFPNESETNITFTPSEEGEYKIRLIVEDNEGDVDQTDAYVLVEPPLPKDQVADDSEKLRILYNRLMKRKILCDVYHEILQTKTKILSKEQADDLIDFGEYRGKTLEDLSVDPERNYITLEKIKEVKTQYGRRKILFFACTAEHAKTISLVLNACYNIKSKYVLGEMDIDERVRTIEEFKTGDLDVICNFNVLTTGFDAPKIDCVFVARPAKSTLLYTQMIGRGMRGTRSGGTEDVLLVDIDDNFQLSERAYPKESGEEIVKLGWKLFADFWKPWSQYELPKYTCMECKSEVSGLSSIMEEFDIKCEPGVLNELLKAKNYEALPKKCKNCINKELQRGTAQEVIELLPSKEEKILEEPKIEEHKQEEKIIPKPCPFVNFLRNQTNFQGNYQIVLGLYAISAQRRNQDEGYKSNLFDARQFLLGYNPDKTPDQIGNNHPVFDVYEKNGLIKNIDRKLGILEFVRIKDMDTFTKLCEEKMKWWEDQHPDVLAAQSYEAAKAQVPLALKSDYLKIKRLLRMVPTYTQMLTLSDNGKDIQKLYGGYNKFLEAIGEPHLPYEIVPLEIIKERREELLSEIRMNTDRFGREKAIDMLIEAESVPYVVWFGSKKSFVAEISKIDWRYEKIYEKRLEARKHQTLPHSFKISDITKKIFPKTILPNPTIPLGKKCPRCGSKLNKLGERQICSSRTCTYYE